MFIFGIISILKFIMDIRPKLIATRTHIIVVTGRLTDKLDKFINYSSLPVSGSAAVSSPVSIVTGPPSAT